jgi:DNA-binding MarR family transcriptional regulator
MKKTTPAMPDLYRIWMRIWSKMNVLENLPYNFGVDEPLFLSEIHTIQAIGKTPENNVRIIAETLGVTPSAASQAITKLTKRGLVRKIRGIRNEKEVSLKLTQLGLVAYNNHEEVHAKTYARIIEQIGTLNEEERTTMERVFSAFESVYDDSIEERIQGAPKETLSIMEV